MIPDLSGIWDLPQPRFAYGSAHCLGHNHLTGFPQQLSSRNRGLGMDHLTLWFLLHELFDFTVPAKSRVPSELGAVKELAARRAGLTLGEIATLWVGFGDVLCTPSILFPLRIFPSCSCRGSVIPLVTCSRRFCSVEPGATTEALISSGHKVRYVPSGGQVRTLCAS